MRAVQSFGCILNQINGQSWLIWVIKLSNEDKFIPTQWETAERIRIYVSEKKIMCFFSLKINGYQIHQVDVILLLGRPSSLSAAKGIFWARFYG